MGEHCSHLRHQHTGDLALIVLLRISGKRTLSKMNAFDLVVTIALGSTLATVVLNKNVALADGVLALALLICLQFIFSWLSVRNKAINKMVKSTPALLVYKGKMLKEAMKQERIATDEIMAVLRQQGMTSLNDALAVVLETDGSLSVIKNELDDKASVLEEVRKPKNTT